jgi:hypothetical protein
VLNPDGGASLVSISLTPAAFWNFREERAEQTNGTLLDHRSPL